MHDLVQQTCTILKNNFRLDGIYRYEAVYCLISRLNFGDKFCWSPWITDLHAVALLLRCIGFCFKRLDSMS